MALPSLITALFFLVALATRIQLSSSQLLIGKLSCLDCHGDFDFSGIKVQVRCAQVKKSATALAKEDGSFEVELPSKAPTTSQNCVAKLVGGPRQLYGWRKNLFSKVVKSPSGDDDGQFNTYTISTPLAFSTVCPLNAKCEEFGSSKTVDLPLPPEWGLAPSSFYVPFFPIIGIP